MQGKHQSSIDPARAQRRLITLNERLRLLVLRRAGLRIRLRELRRTEGLTSATLCLAIAEAETATGAPLYPTAAARRAVFTLTVENNLVLHALAAMLDHVRRRLELSEAELTAVRAERADLRAVLRLTLPSRGHPAPVERER